VASPFVDASQVDAFARRLHAASTRVESESERFEEEWGGKWADEMRADVAVATGTLRDSIDQVEPGGITFGAAYYWRYVEYGTSKMSPQPFIRPAMNRIRKPAAEDASDRAVRLIARG
jgi:HK97 gp10 family phage protein